MLILFASVDVVFISLNIMEDPSDAELVVMINVLPAAFVPNNVLLACAEFTFTAADCRNAVANC